MTRPSKDTSYRFFYAQHGRSKTVNDILDFAKLPTGWHYGRGGPISPKVCKWALQLYVHAINSGFSITEAFPGVDGEVMVSVYYRQHAFDFTINPDGSVDYRLEINDNDVEVADNLTLEAAKQKLTIFGIVLWNLSASSTPNISAKKEADSLISPSSRLRMVGEYPLSTETVPWQQQVNHSVDT
jgi:hypothetical protein